MISLSKKVHINVYFEECVNGAIKKSDQFYPSLFCVPLRMYEIYFSIGKKKKKETKKKTKKKINKQSESITVGRF